MKWKDLNKLSQEERKRMRREVAKTTTDNLFSLRQAKESQNETEKTTDTSENTTEREE